MMMARKLKTLISGLIIAVSAVCLGALLVFTLPTGWKALDIVTGSMRPGLPPGTLVIVHRVPDSTLKVGDVITYKSLIEPGKLVSHRIIQVKSIDGRIPAFIVKGDANPVPDPEVVAGQVVGKVAAHIPYVGRLWTYSHSPLGLGVIVLLPGFLIISYEIELLVRSLAAGVDTSNALPSVGQPRRFVDGMSARTAALLGCLTVLSLVMHPTHANLTSNPVTLTNTLVVAGRSGGECSTITISNTGPGSNNTVTCSKTTTISVTNSTGVTVGNLNTQSATGGSVSNSSLGSSTITVSNY